MFAAEWGTGQVLLSMIYFFLFVIWVWMVTAVFVDVVRSPDLSGWAKALWSVFVIVLPFLGVFAYLVARGGKMTEHAADRAVYRDAAYRYPTEPMTTGPSEVDQLATLAALRSEGAIDDVEYRHMKAKVMA